MGRLARVVLPGIVHHVTQRGVRSMDLFFSDADRIKYLSLLKEQAERTGMTFVGYCLMTNHIHLLLIPEDADSLRCGIGEVHRLYTRYINFLSKVRGHLFQGRFFSCPLDDAHFPAAARYVERNSVRAGLVESAEQYRWSSARYHLGYSREDPLIIKKHRGIGTVSEWGDWLKSDPADLDQLRQCFRTGRPLGGDTFLRKAETITGRNLLPKKAGRPRMKH